MAAKTQLSYSFVANLYFLIPFIIALAFYFVHGDAEEDAHGGDGLICGMRSHHWYGGVKASVRIRASSHSAKYAGNRGLLDDLGARSVPLG